uniref:Protein S100-A10 n=1 Tax=Equus asinus TaxID=9793 RepID=A0A9L0JAQ0_EQUAS
EERFTARPVKLSLGRVQARSEAPLHSLTERKVCAPRPGWGWGQEEEEEKGWGEPRPRHRPRLLPPPPPPRTKAPNPPRAAHWPRVPAAERPPPAPPAKVSTNLTKMPSQMEHAMETMMFTFHKFAGDKGYLTKEDLRVLMEKEFPGFLENQKDPLAVDKIMKDLDQCRDGKVGFQSFFSLIAGLTIACNDYFVVHMKQKGRK